MSKIGPSKVPGEKAGPNGSFPIGDSKHAKLAIGGATHSYNAGNISKSTEEHIKAEARAKLKGSDGGKGAQPQFLGARKAQHRGQENAYDTQMHSGEVRSGIEQAMGAHADQLHPVKRLRRMV